MRAKRGAGNESVAVERRPTPLDPYPQPRSPSNREDAPPRPRELASDAIAVLEGRTFMFSDSRGDVAAGSTGGLVHEDTRFVSRWELRLDGAPLSLLKSGPVDYDSAAFFLTISITSCGVQALSSAMIGVSTRRATSAIASRPSTGCSI